MAHEENELNDIRAILGNDVAIKSYREGKLPFPEGTIIARIAWKYSGAQAGRSVCKLLVTPTRTKVSPILSSNCFGSTLLA